MRVNKVISIMLGAALGIVPSYGAYQSQYLNYIPTKTEVRISDLIFSEETEYEVIGVEPEELSGTESPEAPTHILREDTLLHFDDEIPYEVQECAQIYGGMYDICPELLEAIAYTESSYIPEAVNGSCVGLMQINLDCQDQLDRMDRFGLEKEDMYEIHASMIVAADYLRELFEDYEDPAEVLMRYNGDRTGFKRYQRTGEISDYARGILQLSEELERKHGK